MNVEDETSNFDIGRIDEVIHGRVRLGIMACLAGVESADFGELKARLQTTDGNRSGHFESWRRRDSSPCPRASRAANP